jgi:hypothetical protein
MYITKIRLSRSVRLQPNRRESSHRQEAFREEHGKQIPPLLLPGDIVATLIFPINP